MGLSVRSATRQSKEGHAESLLKTSNALNLLFLFLREYIERTHPCTQIVVIDVALASRIMAVWHAYVLLQATATTIMAAENFAQPGERTNMGDVSRSSPGVGFGAH